MAAPPAASDASDSLDVTGAHAVVEWLKPDGQSRCLSSIETESEAGHITFDCHFRPSSSTASFRLRAPMQIKGLGRKLTPFFIVVTPERIQSVVYENFSKTHLPENVKLMGSGEVVSLRFKLSHASDLVVPPQSPLVPKKKVFWDVFDTLKMLCQELDFVVYLRQTDMPSEKRLASFCEAITAGTVTTSTAHADITRLYDGKGGQILKGEGLAVPATASLPGLASMDVPPSYNELGPPPPTPSINKEVPTTADKEASASSSRKRRRISTSPDDVDTDDVTPGTRSQDFDRAEAICRKLMGEMTAKWREDNDQLRCELRQMEARVKEWVDERLNKHVQDLRHELEQTSVEQQNYADGEVHEVRRETQEALDRIGEVNDDMEVFKYETSEIIESRLEERVDAVRGELEEFLTEKMHEAQDSIVDHIRSNVYIDFNIYD